MKDHPKSIEMVPISQITVINPRSRNRRIFLELVDSIAGLGLKKPITVSRKPDGNGFYLVCGQGRMEAFVELGQHQIPAAIIDASLEDSLVMSLVENLARRSHSSLELVNELGALRERGYSVNEIAEKTGFSREYTQSLCFLLENGEERLLAGVERGIIPPSVAMEIARAKDGDVQHALAEAYAQKLLPGNQLLAIRKIIDSRELFGKDISKSTLQKSRPRHQVSALTLVKAYKKESERQTIFLKNANLTKARLVFVLNCLKLLLDDEHFVTLLRAEQLLTMPRQISDLLPESEALRV